MAGYTGMDGRTGTAFGNIPNGRQDCYDDFFSSSFFVYLLNPNSEHSRYAQYTQVHILGFTVDVHK